MMNSGYIFEDNPVYLLWIKSQNVIIFTTFGSVSKLASIKVASIHAPASSV